MVNLCMVFCCAISRYVVTQIKMLKPIKTKTARASGGTFAIAVIDNAGR